MIFDMNGIIESPMGYDAESGQQIAVFYILGGFVWSIVTGIGLCKSFKKLVGSKNRIE